MDIKQEPLDSPSDYYPPPMVLIPSRLIKEEPIEDEEAEESQISLNRPSEDQQIGFVLPDEEELQTEIPAVTGSKKFCCARCPASYTDKRHLMAHAQKKHPLDGFVCEARGCSAGMFLDRALLDAHFSQNHALKDLRKGHSCRFCDYKCKKKNELDLHVAQKHAERTIPCPDCDRMFAHKASLTQHHVRYHAEKQKCKHCGEMVQVMKMHLQRLSCSHCDAVLACYTLKQRHTREVHKNVKGLQVGDRPRFFSKVKFEGGKITGRQCKVCNFECATETEMNKHVKLTHLRERVQCFFLKCFKYFHNQQELQRHFDEEHAETARENNFRYNCDFCTLSTNVKTNITLHILSHHLPKVIQCPGCTLKFADQRMLDKHTSKAHNSKPRCLICGKKHLKDSPCFRCYQVFPCYRLAREHSKSCSVPFHCRQCENSTYKTLNNLNSHLRKYHKAITLDDWQSVDYRHKGHKCEPCRRFFATEFQLDKHNQHRHKPDASHTRPVSRNKKIAAVVVPKKETDLTESEVVEDPLIIIPKLEIRTPSPFEERIPSPPVTEPERTEPSPEPISEDYSCANCDKTFPNKNMLKNHQESTHDEKKLCKYCGELVQVMRNHTMKRSCMCSYCDASFPCLTLKHSHTQDMHKRVQKEVAVGDNLASFSRSKKVGGKKVAFECKLCPFVSITVAQMGTHVKQTHLKERVRCNFLRCHKYFPNHPQLRIHFDETHATEATNFRFTCDFCMLSVDVRDRITDHILSSHLPKLKKCRYCPSKFALKRLLRRHMVNVHKKVVPREQKESICPRCYEAFSCEKLKQEHAKSCSVPFHCRLCNNKQFAHRKSLRGHRHKMHKPIEGWRGVKYQEKGHKCEPCKRFFYTPLQLQKHLRVQHVDEPASSDFLLVQAEEANPQFSHSLCDPLAVKREIIKSDDDSGGFVATHEDNFPAVFIKKEICEDSS